MRGQTGKEVTLVNLYVKVEEADSRGFQCYEESGEKMYRIWVKENNEHEKEREIW
jgi:hypothetical protein